MHRAGKSPKFAPNNILFMIILLMKHFLPVSNDDTEALFAIDFDDGGLWQAHMSHKFGLVDGGQRVECCVVDVAVAEVDRKSVV